MRLTNEACWEHLRGAGHGILCTTNAKGVIDAVPVCFAISGKLIATPIDRVKPKDTTELGRLKNLDGDARATLICDHWKRHDWAQLWWVRAHLVRRSGHDVSDKVRSNCEAALREKYEQYRDPDADTDFDEVIVFEVKTLVGWAATDDTPVAESEDTEVPTPTAPQPPPPPMFPLTPGGSSAGPSPWSQPEPPLPPQPPASVEY